jgi:hypothetical protein
VVGAAVVEGWGCVPSGVANCTRWASAGNAAKANATAARQQTIRAVLTRLPFAATRRDYGGAKKPVFNTKGRPAGQERLAVTRADGVKRGYLSQLGCVGRVGGGRRLVLRFPGQSL